MYRQGRNSQYKNHDNYNQHKEGGFFSKLSRSLRRLAYNTAELIRPDDGFYPEERRYSRQVLATPQYYPGSFNPGVSVQSPFAEDRAAYKQYVKENEIYIPAKDEVVEEIPNKAGGLGKKLQLKAKNKVSSMAKEASKVAKGAASVVTNVASVGAEETMNIMKDYTLSTLEGSNIKVPDKVKEVLSDTTKKTSLDVVGSFVKGFNGEVHDYDLDADEIENKYKEVDLYNLSEPLQYDKWYTAMLDSPVKLTLDNLCVTPEPIPPTEIKEKKAIPESKDFTNIVSDVIMFIPTKTRYAVVKDTKKDGQFRDIQIKLSYDEHEGEEYRNYTCKEIYLHARSKKPVIIYFRISSKEL